jgi:ubiquinone/menaquinone biosynthesis C-methylase UbiE
MENMEEKNHLEKVKSFHDRDAEWYERARYQQKTCESMAYQQRKEIILNMIDGCKGTILDIGCGPGILTAHLVDRGFRVFNADLSIGMLKKAREDMEEGKPDARKGDGSAFYMVSDASNISMMKEKADSALCIGVITYLKDYNLLLSEAKRILKPNGLFIVQVNKIKFPFLYGKAIKVYHVLKNFLQGKKSEIDFEMNLFDYENFLNDLDKYGMVIKEIGYYDFRIPFVDILFCDLSMKMGKWMKAQGKKGVQRLFSHGIIIKAQKEVATKE